MYVLILSDGQKAKKKVRRYKKGCGLENIKEEEVSDIDVNRTSFMDSFHVYFRVLNCQKLYI